MRIIGFLLRKEFSQIFRNKSILALIIVMPVMQLIILPLAADYEVKNINLAVIDNDHSTYSQRLISKITASGYFKLAGYNASFKDAFALIESDKADLILEIPQHFEKNLIRENKQQVFIAVNAINGTKANLGGAYLAGILRNYNADLRLQLISPSKVDPLPVIEITSSNWFNAYMNYRVFMVPGILAILVTMIGGFLSALNIVKEKEIGTIEQINVTPKKKYQFILVKLIPLWLLGLVVLTIGLLIMRFVYQIHPAGNVLVVYFFAGVYLLSVLGLGLLISTFADTQQQAMLISFFLLMIFILLGGLFTPIDSMPLWVQKITWLNPVSYFIEVVRMVVLKGSGLADVKNHFFIILGFAVVINGLAIFNYKKTS